MWPSRPGLQLGVQSPPTHIRSYQRSLNKFTQAINLSVFGELFSWLFSNLVFDNYTLDFDSTVMGREGNLEGTAKGYNPKRPGRLSHHPLLAFASEVRMVATSGCTQATLLQAQTIWPFLMTHLQYYR